MTRSALLVALALSVSLAAAAPDAAAPLAGGDALLGELKARDPELVVVRRPPAAPGGAPAPEPASGPAVEGVVGDLMDPAPGGDRRATATAFLAKYGTLFGVPVGPAAGEKPAPDLVPLSEEKELDGHTLVLAPAKNGVPCLSGALTFGFDAAGKLVSASGRYRPVDAARMGKLDAAEATSKALALLAAERPQAYLSANGAVREYLADDGKGALRHVYAVELPLGPARHPERVVLGPDGELLESGSAAANFDGSGNVYPDHPGRDVREMPLTDLEDRADPGAPASKMLWGKYLYPQSDAILHASSKNGKFLYRPRLGEEWGLDLLFYDPRFLEVNVYYHLMRARKHAIEVAKVTSVDVGRPLLFDVWQYPVEGRPETMNNAYYMKAPMEWRFPVINPKMMGGKPLFETGAIDATMIYHEYAHHVVYSQNTAVEAASSTNVERYEAQAIDEGFADYFAFTLSGSETMGDVFGKGTSKPRKVGSPSATMCKVQDAIRASGPSFYFGGFLFATLCRDFETLFGARTLELVALTLKSTTPRTFANFGARMAAVARRVDRRAAADVRTILENRKLAECPLSALDSPGNTNDAN